MSDFVFTRYKDEIPDVNTVDMSGCLNVTDAGLYWLAKILKLRSAPDSKLLVSKHMYNVSLSSGFTYWYTQYGSCENISGHQRCGTYIHFMCYLYQYMVSVQYINLFPYCYSRYSIAWVYHFSI